MKANTVDHDGKSQDFKSIYFFILLVMVDFNEVVSNNFKNRYLY